FRHARALSCTIFKERVTHARIRYFKGFSSGLSRRDTLERQGRFLSAVADQGGDPCYLHGPDARRFYLRCPPTTERRAHSRHAFHAVLVSACDQSLRPPPLRRLSD